MLIAVAKWIGTLAPTIAIGVYEHSPFILGIGVLCSVFDLVYIGLLRNTQAAARAPETAAAAAAPAVSRSRGAPTARNRVCVDGALTGTRQAGESLDRTTGRGATTPPAR
jgi:hypothetical protein